MSQATIKRTQNGFLTLAAALKAGGYTGNSQLSYCKITNQNDTPLYVHLSNNGAVQPAVGADGDSIGNNESSKVFHFNLANSGSENFLDAGTTWLYSAADVVIKISVVGGGI